MIESFNFFLYPKNLYRGDFTPDNLLLDTNTQDFISLIGYVCILESEGKVTPEEAYKQIKKVWHELPHNKPEV